MKNKLRTTQNRPTQNRQEGFSLIELMVVILILGVMAALVLPTMLNGKKSSNEASAISALRSINSAQEMYHARVRSFGSVSDLTAAGFLDETFDADRSGYTFNDDAAPSNSSWAVVAEPVNPGTTGDRFFFVDTSGVIRYTEGSPADAGATPVQ